MFRAVVSRKGLASLGAMQSGGIKSVYMKSAVRGLSASEPGYLKRQEKLGRPVSPHVTIYAFPLAAITSVTHRVTGGMLTIGMCRSYLLLVRYSYLLQGCMEWVTWL